MAREHGSGTDGAARICVAHVARLCAGIAIVLTVFFAAASTAGADGEATTSLFIKGDPGDLISHSTTTDWSDPGIRFSLASPHDLSVVLENDASVPLDWFRISLSTGDGSDLAPGRYEPTSSQSGLGRPSLDVASTAGGCSGWGAFDLRELTTADGEVASLAVDFEFRCENQGPGLFGSIRVNSSLPIDRDGLSVRTFLSPARFYASSSSGVELNHSDQHDWTDHDAAIWGRGTAERAQIEIQPFGGRPSDNITIIIAGPDGLEPGRFEDVGHPLLDSGEPGFEIRASSIHPCLDRLMDYELHEIEFDVNGMLTAVAIDFDHYCGPGPSISGALRFNSSVTVDADRIDRTTGFAEAASLYLAADPGHVFDITTVASISPELETWGWLEGSALEVRAVFPSTGHWREHRLVQVSVDFGDLLIATGQFPRTNGLAGRDDFLPGLPALRIAVDGQRCYGGALVIGELDVGARDAVTRLSLDFEHLECGTRRGIFGAIRINSEDPIDREALDKKTVSKAASQLLILSRPGNDITRSERIERRHPASFVTAWTSGALAHVQFDSVPGRAAEVVKITIGHPNGPPLPGFYEPIERPWSEMTEPGLAIEIGGRRCSRPEGWLDVLEASYGRDDQVTSLAVDFVLSCGGGPISAGSVRVGSSIGIDEADLVDRVALDFFERHPSPCPQVTDSIYRLYTAYFLREPDETGWPYWLALYAQRGTGLPAISGYFAASNEFQQRYGALDNGAFVDLIYLNVLGRLPDPAGRAHWVSSLDAGYPRGSVMLAFSESEEYVNRTETWAPLAGYLRWYGDEVSFECGLGSVVIQLPEARPDLHADVMVVNSTQTLATWWWRLEGGLWPIGTGSSTLDPGFYELFWNVDLLQLDPRSRQLVLESDTPGLAWAVVLYDRPHAPFREPWATRDGSRIAHAIAGDAAHGRFPQAVNGAAPDQRSITTELARQLDDQ